MKLTDEEQKEKLKKISRIVSNYTEKRPPNEANRIRN